MGASLKVAFLVMLAGVIYAGNEYWEFQTNEVPGLETALTQAEQNVQAKQSEIQRLRAFADNIQQVKLELRELNLQLESALESMPRAFNLSGLLRKFSMLAQNSGVEIASFRPARDEVRAPQGFYSTLDIEYDLRGGFPQILVFLDQITRLKRIINIQDVRLSLTGEQRQTAQSRVGSTQVNAIVSLITYRFAE